MSDPFGELPAKHYIKQHATRLTRQGLTITQGDIETIADIEDVTPAYVRRVIEREGLATQAVTRS